MAMTSDNNVTGLAAAIRAAGGKKKQLAAMLGLSGAAITRWGDTVPMGRVVEVEKATGVPRSVLRPDLFAPQVEAA